MNTIIDDEKYMSKKLTAGELLDYAVSFIAKHTRKLLLILLIFQIPAMFVLHLALNPGDLFMSFITDSMSGDAASQNLIVDVILNMFGYSFSSIYGFTFEIIFSMMVIQFTYSAIMYEREEKKRDLFKKGAKKLGWGILGTLIQAAMAYAAVMAVYAPIIIILLLTPFITDIESTAGIIIMIVLVGLVILAGLLAYGYFVIRSSFINHCIMIDGCGAGTALRHSFALTKKNFKSLLFPFVFAYLFTLFGNAAIESVVSVITVTGIPAARLLSAVAGGLTAIVSIFMPVFTTIVYINLKKRNGELDFEKKLEQIKNG